MHSELGWLYPSPSMEAGVWLWKDGLKWLWTQKPPFLHSIDQGSWLYFYGNVGEKRLFYAYSSKKWIALENGVIHTNYSQNPDDPDNNQQILDNNQTQSSNNYPTARKPSIKNKTAVPNQ